MKTPIESTDAADAPKESVGQTADARVWLNRTVVGAGLTSALGDLCYETTTVILPGFLAVLGIPAAALGIIEGIADAVASFTKMLSGYVGDMVGQQFFRYPTLGCPVIKRKRQIKKSLPH